MLICLIAMTAAWLQMAFTKDAGLGAHHVVLLWPLPQWFLAVVFVQATAWQPLRWKHAGTVLLASAVLFLTVENLLVTNEYFYQLSAYGPTKSWSDAIFQLSKEAGHIQADYLVLDDWGILPPLVVLNGNRLPIVLVDQSFLAPGSDKSRHDWSIQR
jgi:hypothetical protein